MKPMLLCQDNPDVNNLTYPVYVLPKLDGIRCLGVEGEVVSRTLKAIPNNHIRKTLRSLGINGMDGELIVGNPTDKDVYRNTNSVVMAYDKVAPFKYYVFDYWNMPESTYKERYEELAYMCWEQRPIVEIVPARLCYSVEELLLEESKLVSLGYEGVIIRNPKGAYKQGRTTMKENNAYKLKRYIDDEAVVVGMAPEMQNNNEATVNALGHIERSIHKENLVAKDSLGKLIVNHPVFGEFSIGTGFTAEERLNLWRSNPIGQTVKFKYFPVGVKDKPRHPVFLGFRNMEIDG